ncbi:MAG TPA: hypothetical protein VHR41_02700 [Gemmatimonadales bacterium]|jgi:hypothetical protein|nr:hypothetical protein [Gemmatimonadales bacterium]
MFPIAQADPSPIVQTAVYLAGVLGGYLLLTTPDDWAWVRETVRSAWDRRRRD